MQSLNFEELFGNKYVRLQRQIVRPKSDGHVKVQWSLPTYDITNKKTIVYDVTS